MIRSPLPLIVLIVVLAGSMAAPAGSGRVPELFVTADRCMACHNGLSTPTGDDASIGVDWRSSMMANAARDPYWQAAIRRETLEHPAAAAAIENECSACHMPMARFQANANGEQGEVFAHLPLTLAGTPSAHPAADGVSCALCHQIRDERLGDQESFTAGFVVDTATTPGRRQVFGPYDVDPGRESLMRSASRFRPVQGAHLQESEVCATCHTLYTHALSPDGEDLGEFPEQVPYLEWRHSAYRSTRSCQSCHMPEIEGEMAIASVMGLPRREVSRHAFRGGNFFMPRLLNRYRDELAVQALPQELETTSRRTADHLAGASARLALEDVELAGNVLRGTVAITNLAGHKLPSAYPSRRAWVHVTVHDATGKLVFESGRFNPDGSVQGNDNDTDAGAFEPHYETIDGEDQVQVYESIMTDSADALTTVLLSAVRYAKDNRLLPDGFDKATASDDIAVRGRAAQDESFTGGGDRVRYRMDVSGAAAPFTVRAELHYQPIALRWAQNLRRQEADEIERFVRYYDSLAGGSAVALARDSATVP